MESRGPSGPQTTCRAAQTKEALSPFSASVMPFAIPRYSRDSEWRSGASTGVSELDDNGLSSHHHTASPRSSPPGMTGMPNYKALLQLLDGEEAEGSIVSHTPDETPPGSSRASAASPTPIRQTGRPEDEDLTLRTASASPTIRRSRPSVRSTAVVDWKVLALAQLRQRRNTSHDDSSTDILRLKAEVERLRAVVAAATATSEAQRRTAANRDASALAEASREIISVRLVVCAMKRASCGISTSPALHSTPVRLFPLSPFPYSSYAKSTA